MGLKAKSLTAKTSYGHDYLLKADVVEVCKTQHIANGLLVGIASSCHERRLCSYVDDYVAYDALLRLHVHRSRLS